MQRQFAIMVMSLLVILLGSSGCKKLDTSSADSDNMSQQLGDAMNAIDDSGGSDGGYVLMTREAKVFARLSPEKISPFTSLIPKAQAVACSDATTFGSCTNNQLVRTFTACSLGTASVTGTITFDFNDGVTNNVCTNDSDGDTITRSPSFTITGARGGTYTVSKTATIGQRITRTSAGVFQFTNDGIRRVLAWNGSTLSDYTTSTTSAIGITGATRNGRVANGGTLRITSNGTGSYCDFTPNSVTWTTTCSCATSGSWTATCSDGSTATFAITGCGTGTMASGTQSQTLTLDQCS